MIDIAEKPKARVVKVGREIPHPTEPGKTVFTGFEFDGIGIDGVAGLEYGPDGIYIGGYTLDELRQVIAEKPAE